LSYKTSIFKNYVEEQLWKTFLKVFLINNKKKIRIAIFAVALIVEVIIITIAIVIKISSKISVK
jgi:hypothetical protein